MSYSSSDRDFARRLAGDIERAGHEIWLDEHRLTIGEDLTSIETAIEGSGCVVVIVSEASASSPWVDREIQRAQSLGIRVLPVMLENPTRKLSEGVAALAHADFRRPQDYRRSAQRLVAALVGRNADGIFLSAKQAVAKVRAAEEPAGDLFGVSQQGVATLYTLAHRRAWELADVSDGLSRLWIVEFCRGADVIAPYLVLDGAVRSLETLRVCEAGVALPPDAIVHYLSAVFEDEGSPTFSVSSTRAASTEGLQKLRAYSRFYPIPLNKQFVDSTDAVAAAVRTAFSPSGPAQANQDLITLAKLECDKRNYQLPTWKVSFFDPTLHESVLTVGVNPLTGAIRDERMHGEMINADLMSMRKDDVTGAVTIRDDNQRRAIAAHCFDIPDAGAPPQPGLTAAQAMRMASEHMGPSRDWQLGFVSNTGMASRPAMLDAGLPLMMRSGIAGQWVVEMLGTKVTPVFDGTRRGHKYLLKVLVCTRKNGVTELALSELVLTSPLTQSPLSGEDVLTVYERARRLAIDSVDVDFFRMSVALRRPQTGAEWHFRFYDNADIVASLLISYDGRRVLPRETAPIDQAAYESASALEREAEELAAARQPTEAANRYERAARQFGHARAFDDEARMGWSAGVLYARARDYPKAVKALSRPYELFYAVGAKAQAADCLFLIADVQARQGHADAARDLYDKAAELFESIGNVEQLTNVMAATWRLDSDPLDP